jgi:homoserine kinase
LRLENRLPLARGLGSSSAAIVGGLAAANAACGGFLTRDELLRLAAEEEGHPDNVAPALLGGLCASAMRRDGGVHCVSWRDEKIFRGVRAVVCVPAFELSTKRARAVLPDRVSRRDAIFNVSRTALLLSAFKERRFDLLAEAMEDRLHQPYRKRLIPGWDDVLASARKAGAWGAALSGAGPTILAFAPTAKAERVGRAMAAAFARHRTEARWHALSVDFRGARVVSVAKGRR